MNRAERRREKREPAILAWAVHASPKQLKQGNGWFGELDKVYSQNGNYVVMTREVQTEWGTVIHACVRNAASTDIPWAEKQRIINELFGEESVAVEVFPKESELVDAANMYHLWILPKDMELPFKIY